MTLLNVISYNSQGEKSGVIWRRLKELSLCDGNTDLLVFVCESGRPPWIKKRPGGDDDYFKKSSPLLYSQGKGASWFEPKAGKESIEEALKGWNAHGDDRITPMLRPEAMWLPWQAQLEKQSLRCSLSLYWFPSANSKLSFRFGVRDLERKEKRRPVIAALMKNTSTGAERGLGFAHLVANQNAASESLVKSARLLASAVGESTPMMILGDLNIDASKDPVTPLNWKAALSGSYTWKNVDTGKESQLDWGTYTEKFTTADPVALWRYKEWLNGGNVPIGPSDHSMLKYAVTV